MVDAASAEVPPSLERRIITSYVAIDPDLISDANGFNLGLALGSDITRVMRGKGSVSVLIKIGCVSLAGHDVLKIDAILVNIRKDAAEQTAMLFEGDVDGFRTKELELNVFRAFEERVGKGFGL